MPQSWIGRRTAPRAVLTMGAVALVWLSAPTAIRSGPPAHATPAADPCAVVSCQPVPLLRFPMSGAATPGGQESVRDGCLALATSTDLELDRASRVPAIRRIPGRYLTDSRSALSASAILFSTDLPGRGGAVSHPDAYPVFVYDPWTRETRLLASRDVQDAEGWSASNAPTALDLRGTLPVVLSAEARYAPSASPGPRRDQGGSPAESALSFLQVVDGDPEPGLAAGTPIQGPLGTGVSVGAEDAHPEDPGTLGFSRSVAAAWGGAAPDGSGDAFFVLNDADGADVGAGSSPALVVVHDTDTGVSSLLFAPAPSTPTRSRSTAMAYAPDVPMLGDVDGDGMVSGTDAYLLERLVAGAASALPNAAAGDVTLDGTLDDADVQALDDALEAGSVPAHGIPVGGTPPGGVLHVATELGPHEPLILVVRVDADGPIGAPGTRLVGAIVDRIPLPAGAISSVAALAWSREGLLFAASDEGVVAILSPGDPLDPSDNELEAVLRLTELGHHRVAEPLSGRLTALSIGDAEYLQPGAEELIVGLGTPRGGIGHVDLGPEIAIVSPPDGWWYRGVLELRADASDPDGVADVQLVADADLDGLVAPGEILRVSTAPPHAVDVDTSAFPDGAVHLMAIARDVNGLRSTASRTVRVDNTPPEILSVEPADGVFTSNALPRIAATFRDALSGIDAAATTLRVGGIDVTAQATAGTDEIAFVPPAPLADGTYLVELEVRDVAGNAATRAWSFVIDTVPPAITDLLPSDGTLTADALAAIGASYADATSGIDLPSVRLTLDGADVTSASDVEPDTILHVPAAALELRTHAVELSVRDVAGNASVAAWAFTVFDPADGGTVSDPYSTAEVELPAGALPPGGSVSISIRAIPCPDAGGLSPDQDCGGAVRVLPEGTTFLAPVTLRVPIARYKVPGTPMQLGLLDESTGTFVFEPAPPGSPAPAVDWTGRRLQADVVHFSTYAAIDGLVSAGGGALGGGAEVPLPELFTGSFRRSIALEVPPGRHGVEPDLTLHYDSSRGNGWLGMGWDLDLGTIERVGKDRLMSYADPRTVRFAFRNAAGGKELQYLVPGEHSGEHVFQATLESDHTRFTYDDGDDSWTAVTKDGMTMTFGDTATAKLAGTSGTHRWMLTRLVDPNGNYMTVEYAPDPATGNAFPAAIDYTGHEGGPAPWNRVELVTETRPDVSESYRTLSRVALDKRLSEVRMLSDGRLVRRYELRYDASPMTGRSLLASVQEFGSDGVTSLPPVRLAYESSTEKGWVEDPAWAWTGPSFVDGSERDEGVRFADVNGDGWTDVIRGNDLSAPTRATWLNTGTGWTRDTAWDIPVAFITSGRIPRFTTQWAITDANADGLTDFISPFDSRMNTGSGWVSEAQWGSPVSNIHSLFDIGAGIAPVQGGSPQASFFDFNGDGWTDVVMDWWWHGQDETSGSITWTDERRFLEMRVNTRNGWSGTHAWTWPGAGSRTLSFANYSYIFFVTSRNATFRFGGGRTNVLDFNGDGLTDLLEKHGSPPSEAVDGAWLNDGRGWQEQARWRFPGEDLVQGGWHENLSNGFQVADVNGDGLPDLIQSIGTRRNSWINTGLQWALDPAWNAPSESFADADGSGNGVELADVNGDGMVDILVARSTGARRAFINKARKPDLLTRVDDGTGGVTTIGYKPSTWYRTPGGQLANPELPFPVTTVERITVTDNLPVGEPAESYTDTFAYAGGWFDRADAEFRGFGQVTVTDGATGNTTVTTFHQGRPTDPHAADPEIAETFRSDKALKGRVRHTASRDSLGALVSATQEFWSTRQVGPPGGIVAVALERSRTRVLDGSPVQELVVETTFEHDDVGNVVSELLAGDVATSGDERRSDAEFQLPYLEGFNRKVVARRFEGDGSTLLNETISDYDDRGNLVREETLLVGGINPVKTYVHDELGNRVRVTDAGGDETVIEYDTRLRAFPAVRRNALGHEWRFTFDPGLGKLTDEVDPNAHARHWTFDVLGRLVAESVDGETARTIQHFVHDATTGLGDNREVVDVLQVHTESWKDGLGRELRTVRRGEDGGAPRDILVERTYDAAGRLATETLPHHAGTPAADVSVRRHAYDRLGRIVEVATDHPGTAKDGATTVAYLSPLRTMTTDPLGHARERLTDVHGNVVEVVEVVGGSRQVTRFEHDGRDNLVRVIDALGNETSTVFDSLGRKVELHDPDMGVTRFTYDPDGNLLTSLDAKGQLVRHEYDALDRRARTLYEPGSGMDDVTWVHDEPASENGRGRLTSVIQGARTVRIHHDRDGRQARIERTSGGTTDVVRRTYDVAGRLTSLTYPDGETVSYAYDPYSGLVERAVGARTYVDSMVHDAQLRPERVRLGNGVVTSYSYGADRLLSGIEAVHGATTLVDLAYDFDLAGNLASTRDDVEGSLQEYVHDDLNRLVEARGVPDGAGGTLTRTFAYDAIGNMVSNSAVGSYLYGGPGPHAVTRAGTKDYVYDANGNMILAGTRTFEYDAMNRLARTADGGEEVSFAYDFEGRRVEKATSGGTLQYVDDVFERSLPSGATTKYVFCGGTRVAAVHSTGEVRFFVADVVGSTSVVTDLAGAVVQRLRYEPFGAVRHEVGGGERFAFTDQERDAELGLYDYDARMYDPVLGRFLSPDPLVQDPADPQTLNRYAYTLNNPLVHVDPSGHRSLRSIVRSIRREVDNQVSEARRAADALTVRNFLSAARSVASAPIRAAGSDMQRAYVAGTGAATRVVVYGVTYAYTGSDDAAYVASETAGAMAEEHARQQVRGEFDPKAVGKAGEQAGKQAIKDRIAVWRARFDGRMAEGRTVVAVARDISRGDFEQAAQRSLDTARARAEATARAEIGGRIAEMRATASALTHPDVETTTEIGVRSWMQSQQGNYESERDGAAARANGPERPRTR